MDKKIQEGYLLRIIEGEESLAISIRDDDGLEIGVMCPITKLHLQSSHIIEKMTTWRNQYKVFFQTQFNATPERTKRWLNNVVLANSDQMLFLIYCEGILMGQYGFNQLNGNSAQMDNLMRGERGGHPLLMKYAVRALIKWLFSTMEVEEVYGYTFANNAMAMKLNKDVGFSTVEKIPLTKTIVDGEIRWIVGNPGGISQDNHYYWKIYMNRQTMLNESGMLKK